MRLIETPSECNRSKRDVSKIVLWILIRDDHVIEKTKRHILSVVMLWRSCAKLGYFHVYFVSCKQFATTLEICWSISQDAWLIMLPLHWRHNEHDGASNHQPHDCLLNRLFRRRSKKTSKLRFNDLCEGNSPVTGEFPAQRDSNAEIVPFDDVIMTEGWRCTRANMCCIYLIHTSVFVAGLRFSSMCIFKFYVFNWFNW